jgi:hypothetical protein
MLGSYQGTIFRNPAMGHSKLNHFFQNHVLLIQLACLTDSNWMVVTSGIVMEVIIFSDALLNQKRFGIRG